MVAMLRCRSQRPLSVGALQAAQSWKVQSTGTHGFLHGTMLGHSLIDNWAPLHFVSSGAMNRKLLFTFVMVSARFRIIVPCPQPALQPLASDQSVHAQKRSASQCMSQFITSVALCGSQPMPHSFGICKMDRCRYF
jgi:hypothetical protein